MDDVLEDLLADGLRIVFCGTRPGRISALRRAYYAHPGNRFWPTLHAIGLTPRLFAPQDYPALLGLGIGLTDVAKHTSGPDAAILPDHVDRERLAASLRRYRPRLLAFTSKNAARLATGTRIIAFGRQPVPFAETETFVLPSPSGLATSHWNLGPWQQLADRARETSAHATS